LHDPVLPCPAIAGRHTATPHTAFALHCCALPKHCSVSLCFALASLCCALPLPRGAAPRRRTERLCRRTAVRFSTLPLLCITAHFATMLWPRCTSLCVALPAQGVALRSFAIAALGLAVPLLNCALRGFAFAVLDLARLFHAFALLCPTRLRLRHTALLNAALSRGRSMPPILCPY
jgi:hypothetical protein